MKLPASLPAKPSWLDSPKPSSSDGPSSEPSKQPARRRVLRSRFLMRALPGLHVGSHTLGPTELSPSGSEELSPTANQARVPPVRGGSLAARLGPPVHNERLTHPLCSPQAEALPDLNTSDVDAPGRPSGSTGSAQKSVSTAADVEDVRCQIPRKNNKCGAERRICDLAGIPSCTVEVSDWETRPGSASRGRPSQNKIDGDKVDAFLTGLGLDGRLNEQQAVPCPAANESDTRQTVTADPTAQQSGQRLEHIPEDLPLMDLIAQKIAQHPSLAQAVTSAASSSEPTSQNQRATSLAAANDESTAAGISVLDSEVALACVLDAFGYATRHLRMFHSQGYRSLRQVREAFVASDRIHSMITLLEILVNSDMEGMDVDQKNVNTEARLQTCERLGQLPNPGR
ncbi:hypothetical protein P389DRAFT_193997 [Cystobasidium minutum MCA 4210]|uniref:uncharacterized protein n=1 Tax=Cystobasidium minutum MCA 4210 TaxID=1397322 RepID=UPI0034CE76B7|eukprot:jgi/Rhomi1/193997/gm1.2211_g